MKFKLPLPNPPLIKGRGNIKYFPFASLKLWRSGSGRGRGKRKETQNLASLQIKLQKIKSLIDINQ